MRQRLTFLAPAYHQQVLYDLYAFFSDRAKESASQKSDVPTTTPVRPSVLPTLSLSGVQPPSSAQESSHSAVGGSGGGA